MRIMSHHPSLRFDQTPQQPYLQSAVHHGYSLIEFQSGTTNKLNTITEYGHTPAWASGTKNLAKLCIQVSQVVRFLQPYPIGWVGNHPAWTRGRVYCRDSLA